MLSRIEETDNEVMVLGVVGMLRDMAGIVLKRYLKQKPL
jgi:hypothetical protein